MIIRITAIGILNQSIIKVILSVVKPIDTSYCFCTYYTCMVPGIPAAGDDDKQAETKVKLPCLPTTAVVQQYRFCCCVRLHLLSCEGACSTSTTAVHTAAVYPGIYEYVTTAVDEETIILLIAPLLTPYNININSINLCPFVVVHI